MSSENNKRIAKNTMMLYFRMILTMVVSLYTSRIVLNTLGVEDFGIYNVVGGFVTMLGFLNSAMARGTKRFLAFEIGKSNYPQLVKVFSMSVNIHFLIALIILLFAETIGLWFVNNQLTIPSERIEAANWVYQFSIMAFLVNVVSVPYNAIIIAHERMKVFAWISIIEVSLKLMVVFMLQWFGFDKLKLYAVLIFLVSIIIRLIYGIYCKQNFSESKFIIFWDNKLFKTLISFTGWNLWGNIANVLAGQGLNILLNIFFGPAVNAARGISYQVKGAVNSFVQNFQMALNPQIIKTYAANDIKYMHQIIYQGAKYSYYLLFTISLPILLETEIILKLWLKVVPDFTEIFTRLIIINILIDSFSGPLMTAAQATGNIKLYQGIVGGILLLIVPVSYLFLKLGFPPEITFYVSIVISVLTLIARLIILQNLVSIKIKYFLKNVIFKTLLISIISIILPLVITYLYDMSIQRFIIVGFISILSAIGTIYLVGLTKNEKVIFLNFIGTIKKNNL
jgi:O-antigen/teichoic acid export membrane protein